MVILICLFCNDLIVRQHALGVEPSFGDRRRDVKPLIPPSIQNQSKGKLESEPVKYLQISPGNLSLNSVFFVVF